MEADFPCEAQSAIRFMTERNLSSTDIYQQISEVYGATGMRESKVRIRVRDFIVDHEFFGWEVQDLSPHNLDLMQNDFHLFHYLKHHLSGNHYNDNEAVQIAVTSWLSEKSTSSFRRGYSKSGCKYDTCLNQLEQIGLCSVPHHIMIHIVSHLLLQKF